MIRINKKKNNKLKNDRPQQLRLVKSIVDKPMARDINLQFQVYAIFNQPAAITMYSFSSSTTQVSPSLTQELSTGITSSTEFIRYQGDFAYYKLTNIKIICSNNTWGNTNLVSTPPMFYRVCPQISGTVTADGVGRSDNSVEFKITNFGREIMSNHLLPNSVMGVSGYPVCGKDLWFPTTLVPQSGFQLQIGNITNPDFTGAASLSVKIVSIDVICRVVFAAPYLQ